MSERWDTLNDPLLAAATAEVQRASHLVGYAHVSFVKEALSNAANFIRQADDKIAEKQKGEGE